MRSIDVLRRTTPIAVLLASGHLAEDVVFRLSPAGLENLLACLILAGWLYGPLMMAGQRAGHVIGLLGALSGLALSAIHMRGPGGMLGGEIGRSPHALFFVWTLLALGAISLFSAVVEVQVLRSGAWRRQD